MARDAVEERTQRGCDCVEPGVNEMQGIEPAAYEAWYHTARGRWIGGREFSLLGRLLQPQAGATLLDVGCGTGYFSRRLARAGLQVVGLDPAPAMLAFARGRDAGVRYVEGTARALPFADGAFEYASAITSLCFIPQPQAALQEMWRVARHGVVLGLLNRHSLLYWQKRHSPGYGGARWDRWREVRRWSRGLAPAPARIRHGTALFVPSGTGWACRLEQCLSARLPWGGFLAVALFKS